MNTRGNLTHISERAPLFFAGLDTDGHARSGAAINGDLTTDGHGWTRMKTGKWGDLNNKVTKQQREDMNYLNLHHLFTFARMKANWRSRFSRMAVSMPGANGAGVLARAWFESRTSYPPSGNIAAIG